VQADRIVLLLEDDDDDERPIPQISPNLSPVLLPLAGLEEDVPVAPRTPDRNNFEELGQLQPPGAPAPDRSAQREDILSPLARRVRRNLNFVNRAHAINNLITCLVPVNNLRAIL